MLKLPTGLLTLALVLTVAGALPAPSWAQPVKPKPAPPAATQNEPVEDVEENAGAGKKVKTEGEKARDGKTKPKPADEDGEDSRPGTPVKPGPAKPGSSTPPVSSTPPRDR